MVLRPAIPGNLAWMVARVHEKSRRQRWQASPLAI
jgi:hypothetical protein